MSALSENEVLSRGDLVRAPKPSLIRLARYLGLRVQEQWSNRHLGSLIYWLTTRRKRRLAGRTAW